METLMSRKLFSSKLTLVASACVLALGTANAQTDSITAVSFGGAYGAVQKANQVDTYIEKTGKNVLFENYSGGVAEIKAQVESGHVQWDAIVVETVDLERACSEGLLEVIDPKQMPNGDDGVDPLQDFIPEALSNECGIGEMVWSTVFAYNDEMVGDVKPNSMADLFDTEKIPGKRALRKRPQINLEWALMADGVKYEDVYEVLSTDEGQDRAFKMLDSIKNDVVWFDSWSQAPQLLNDGGALMVQAANGRFYDAINKENKPFVIVWDGNIFDVAVWSAVKGTPKLEQAMDFIKHATSTTPLVSMQEVAYGPVRKSSLAQVAPEVATQLPSSHLDEGIKVDGIFWADYGESLGERFNEWLLK